MDGAGAEGTRTRRRSRCACSTVNDGLAVALARPPRSGTISALPGLLRDAMPGAGTRSPARPAGGRTPEFQARYAYLRTLRGQLRHVVR